MKIILIPVLVILLSASQEDIISVLKDGVFWPAQENRYYQRFKNQTTVQELESLTKDSSYLIRAYAFNAMLEKESPNLEKILDQHLNDTLYIPTVIMGDVIYYQRLIDVLLSNMKQANYPLTERTYEEYKELIPPIVKPIKIEVDIDVNPEDLKEKY